MIIIIITYLLQMYGFGWSVDLKGRGSVPEFSANCSDKRRS